MDKKYWDKFYQQRHTLAPSSFAIYCAQWINQKAIGVCEIYDLGCGNGRDAYYWSMVQGYYTTGVDQSIYDRRRVGKLRFKQSSLTKLLKKEITGPHDIIYSRFFLHVLSKREIRKALKWTQGYFMAEFRIKGDKPVLYPNHRRKFVDAKWLLKELVLQGYSLLFYAQGKGLAPYRGEDPLVGRVIARRVK